MCLFHIESPELGVVLCLVELIIMMGNKERHQRFCLARATRCTSTFSSQLYTVFGGINWRLLATIEKIDIYVLSKHLQINFSNTFSHSQSFLSLSPKHARSDRDFSAPRQLSNLSLQLNCEINYVTRNGDYNLLIAYIHHSISGCL